MPKTIGILALQGAFEKHLDQLSYFDIKGILVRSKDDLSEIDGLIIPGGESTTMGKLLNSFGIMDILREKILGGLPVFGTCAGMILLADKLKNHKQPLLQCMNIEVERNAYGRQIDSFEADIFVPVLGRVPVRAVFIRAPRIIQTGKEVEIIAKFENSPVIVREKKILAASFHPELTNDKRIHEYFLSMV